MTKPRRVGLFICTSLVVGNMIGSGIFLLPASLATYGGWSLAGWILTFAGATLLAGTFARLSRLVPGSGGPYVYTRAGFGDFAAFLVAWGYWVSMCAGNAAIATAAVSYMTVFAPVIGRSKTLSAALALSTVWLFVWVNSRGVREAGIVQLVTTVLKLAPLAAIGLSAIFFADPGQVASAPLEEIGPLAAITASATLTLWAFMGLESATIPAGEVDDPARTIPRATYLGTAIAASVYILTSVAVMSVIPPESLSASNAPFADAAGLMWGDWGRWVIAGGAVISSLGALNGWTLLLGQVPMAAAKDGLFPRVFGRVNSRGTPAAGMTVSSLLITVIIWANYTEGLVGLFTFAVLLATLTALVPYLFSSLAEIVVRRRDSAQGKGHSIVWPILAFCYAFWAIIGAGQEVVYWGFLLILAGLPVYVWIRREES